MTPLGQIFGYLSGALIVVIGMLLASLYHYRVELKEAVSTGIECHMNKNALENAITERNEQIKALEIDYEARVAAIKPITRTVVKERLQTIYVEFNATQEECDEVLSTVDALRRADF